MWVQRTDPAGNLYWYSTATGNTTYAVSPGSESNPTQTGPLLGIAPVSTPRLPPLGAKPLFNPVAGAGTGAVIGSVVPGVGTAIGALAGFLGGLFSGGGSSDPPTLSQQFVDTLRQYFPDQNAPICGTPVDISFLNGGAPGVLDIPCDDPDFGKFTRSTVEWWLKAAGLGVVMSNLFKFIQVPQSTSGSGEDTINITNQVNVTDTSAKTAIDSVAAAVRSAIDVGASNANAIAQSVTADVTKQLDTTSTLLNGFLGAFQTQIPAAFSQLLTGLLNPVNAIEASISNQVSDVGGLVRSIESDIVGPLNGTIAQLGSGLGQVEAAISSQIGAESSLISQLIPVFGSQVPDAINGVEKVLERLGGIFTTAVSSIKFGQIDQDLKNLGHELAGIVGAPIDTVYRPIDLITDSCDTNTLEAQIDKLGGRIDSYDGVLKPLGDILMWVLLQAGKLYADIDHLKQMGEERVNAACPITKIDPATVVSLWRRGLLNEESARHELLVQGYNPDRQQALYDGTAFLEAPATAIDYWYRHIATDDDLRGLLTSNGFSAAQIQAAKAASVQLGNPADSLRGWLWGLLDEGEVNDTLNVNRYDNAQIELLKALSRRPPSPNEVLEGENTRAALGSFTLPSILGLGSDWDSVPQWYRDAGKAAGLNDETIQQNWWAHWQIPPVSVAIQQFFRGMRTYGELTAIMDRNYIPATLQNDLMNVMRPLIPFRTIPTMLSNGVLDEAGARHRLAMHGFDGPDIDVLIGYAKLQKPKASTATAHAAQGVSLATARTLFDDGAITEAQYREVLAEHGLEQSAIDADVQVAQITNAARERRQSGQDIVNEFQAGLIDLATAKQQLAQQGFTMAEQAKYQRQLRTAKTAAAKVPSEADLNHFLQASIISPSDYLAGMEAAGYSSDWASKFLAWRTKPTTTPTPTNTPTPSQP